MKVLSTFADSFLQCNLAHLLLESRVNLRFPSWNNYVDENQCTLSDVERVNAMRDESSRPPRSSSGESPSDSEPWIAMEAFTHPWGLPSGQGVPMSGGFGRSSTPPSLYQRGPRDDGTPITGALPRPASRSTNVSWLNQHRQPFRGSVSLESIETDIDLVNNNDLRYEIEPFAHHNFGVGEQFW